MKVVGCPDYNHIHFGHLQDLLVIREMMGDVVLARERLGVPRRWRSHSKEFSFRAWLDGDGVDV